MDRTSLVLILLLAFLSLYAQSSNAATTIIGCYTDSYAACSAHDYPCTYGSSSACQTACGNPLAGIRYGNVTTVGNDRGFCQIPTPMTCAGGGSYSQALGRCVCAAGYVQSGFNCAALTCPQGQEVVNGSCVSTCPVGQSRVNGTCQCPAGSVPMASGACEVVPTCSGGKEVTLGQDGHMQCACPSGSADMGGSCETIPSCTNGQQVTMGTDGHMTCSCPTGEIVVGGQCGSPLTDDDCAETNQVANPAGTACVDLPYCVPPQVLNADRTGCEVPPGQENCEGGTNTIWDEELGYCRSLCSSGMSYDNALHRCVYEDIPPDDTDTDDDGTPDSEDTDDDNDGTPDSEDPDDNNDGTNDDGTQASPPRDTDHDGINDTQDTDDDNDGIPDSEDDDDNGNGTPDNEDSPNFQFGTVEDVPVAKTEKTFQLNREMSAVGSCPAAIEMQLQSFGVSRQDFVLEWTPVCDFARGVRPFVIIGSLLGAALFLFFLLKP